MGVEVLVPHIVRLDAPATPGVIDHPRPDRLESGNPRRETWTLYESADGQMSAGIWACEVGRWRIVFPPGKDEYFFVLEGWVRLHDRDGGYTDVRAGQGAGASVPPLSPMSRTSKPNAMNPDPQPRKPPS